MWLAFVILFAVPAEAAKEKEADQPLRRMEEKLAKADSLHVAFDVAVAAGEGKGGKVKGTLDSQKGGQARLEMKGDFGEKKFDMLMVSDGKRMSLAGGGPAKEPQDTPKKLDEMVRASFARSGILLPIFLVEPVQEGEKPKTFDPDKQMRVTDVKVGKKEQVDGKEAQVVEYKLTTTGAKEPFSVTVWIDPKTDLPLKRVVRSKQEGDAMTITETYTKAELGKKIEAKTFELPK